MTKNSISKILRDYFNYIVDDVNPALSFFTTLAACFMLFSVIGMIWILIGWWTFPFIALTIFVVGLIISYRANNSKGDN